MISTGPALEPEHWGLTASERTDRGRRFAVAVAVVCALVHVAFTTPVGVLWPVLFFATLLALLALPLWIGGLIHALGARRRHPSTETQRAVLWWLFPAVAIGATAAVVLDDVPLRAAEALVADDLERFAVEADAAAASSPVALVEVDDRLVGPLPCEKLRRYPNGTLRVEFLGTGLLHGRRGLLRLAPGAAIPHGLEITGPERAGGWLPWLERDGR
ncbi:hypothetical protein Pla163_25800 [Planctomycetes bacterium Pla163]|uniref:Uncharacterized protein n=1 Tax=Rohdeia mirabilis TaxID=2528008 RepID=A0A518D1U7_9BACT|nr:hypothetical protein Pla163_25800 [Planctomycetes bacterium Pla163]